MKTLNTYINEWRLTDDSKNKINTYNYFPENFNELRKIVYERYKKCYNKKIKVLDLRDINVFNCKVNNFMQLDFGYGLFREFEKIKIIDITGWNTRKFNHMNCMFLDCYDLEKIIGIENLNVSNVSYFGGMFKGCYSLKSLDLSKWQLSDKVDNLENMFKECKSLETLKGPENWSITKNIKLKQMFYRCKDTIIPSWYDKNKWDAR